MAKKPRNRRSGRKARAAERARIEQAHIATGYVAPKAKNQKQSIWKKLFSR